MEKEYTFINPIYDDIFAAEQQKDFSKVFYFEKGSDLGESGGKITGTSKNEKNEEFLCFDNGDKVRVDRIITINGIPGPAYGEYDGYALACLNCMGGMED